MRNRIISLLWLVLFIFPLMSEDRPPNIVFIFADDFGKGDLACYGHPYALTPHLDQLAKEGTKFERFYATGVTCCPSRTGFMTSRHPASFEKYMSYYGFGDRTTVTQLLQKNGYTTGHFGKWHIGPEKNMPEGIYGLDEVEVIGNSEGVQKGRDDDLFDAAIGFIEKHKEKPFYVNIWGHITHYPVHPHPSFTEHFKDLKVDESIFGDHMQAKFENTRKLGYDVDTCMKNYLADVWTMDQAVGRVVKKLDELGLSENTIVVFSSDQGPAPNGKFQSAKQNKLDHIYKANMLGWAKELRGGKHEQYEGGVNIPFIIRWPGKVPAGHVNKHSVLSGLDWLPTLCELSKTPYDKQEFEGQDISDIWMGSNRNPKRYLFWKASGSPSSLNDKWKFHVTKKGPELYDLSSDPGERKNLASQFPEILSDMKKVTSKWVETLPSEVLKPAKKKKKI